MALTIKGAFDDFERWYDGFTKRQLKELEKAYRESLKATKEQLEKYYKTFSRSGKLTLAEMQKYDRLRKMQKDLDAAILELSRTQAREVQTLLFEVYSEGYNRMGWIAEQATGINLRWYQLPKDYIKKAIQNPVSGLTLTEILEKNRQEILWRIRQEVTQGLIKGESYFKTADRLKAALENNYVKATRIIWTESHRCKEEAQLEAMQKMQEKGVEAKRMWVATLDSKTRDTHRALDGQIEDKDGYFHIRGLKTKAPGMFGVASEDINCIPEDTIICSNKIEAATKREYSGTLIRIRTASGIEFAATPNHPIATPKGWVGMCSLKKGDDILCGLFRKKVSFSNPNINNRPISVGKVFNFLSISCPSKRVRGVDKQFHGDGAAGNVDVVLANGFLKNRRKSSFFKPRSKQIFSFAHLRMCKLPLFGLLSKCFEGFRLATNSIVSLFGKASFFFRSGLGHSEIHGLTSIARSDTCSSESRDDSGSGNIKKLGKGFDRKALKIFSDKIVDIDVFPFSGQIYNLQTQVGWYLASSNDKDIYKGIITHNCRCTTIFVFEGSEPRTRMIQGKGISDYITYSEWKKQKEG